MKSKFLELLESSCSDEKKLSILVSVYELYDQLQYAENIQDMAQMLFKWLHTQYEIDNIDFTIYDIETNTRKNILKEGSDFFLDGELSFYFVINTHIDINAVLSFNASSKKQYEIINNHAHYIDFAFLQISPLLQNGIMKEQYIAASSVDSVTNVYNRQYLVQHIHKIISLSNNEEKSITFLMIGIDHFKAVIDEFDYDVGDKVLVELAKVIHSNIKEQDIVARLTGDEFVVALINLPDIEVATKIAKKIIEEFAQRQIVVDEETQQVLQKTICIGIASYPEDSEDINQVLKYADNFLYEAKNKGRSQYAIYKKEEDGMIELF